MTLTLVCIGIILAVIVLAYFKGQGAGEDSIARDTAERAAEAGRKRNEIDGEVAKLDDAALDDELRPRR